MTRILEQIAELTDTGQKLSDVRGFAELYELVFDLAGQIFKNDTSLLLLKNPKKSTLAIAAGRGYTDEELKRLRVETERGNIGHVFKIGKPSLRFDLSIIALVQVAALTYGVWVVQNERPAAIVFADDRFHPIPYYQLVEAGYKSDELDKFGDDLPVRIFVELPPETEPEARTQLFLEVYQSKVPLFLTGKLYRKLDDKAKSEIARQSIDVPAYLQEKQFTEGGLTNQRAELQQIYDDFIAGADKPASEYLFLALYARHCKCILVAEKSNLDFITVLDIPPPWVTRTELKVSHD